MEKFIVANWKMNYGDDEGLSLLKKIAGLSIPKALNIIIAPPYTLLMHAHSILEDTPFFLSGQDCSARHDGAYTGDISAHMLKMAGCTSVILGHSERRMHHKESSDDVRKKAERAGEVGLLPIICVGETLEEYKSKMTKDVIRRQIEKSVPSKNIPFVVAYEPVWAIGTGEVPEPTIIEDNISFIKDLFQTVPPVLYGGSVNPENIKKIMKTNVVDGALIGGASLDIQKFTAILNGLKH